MGTTFLHAHAAHADGLRALALVNDELRAAASQHARLQPTLGFLYFSDHHAARAEALLDALRSALAGRGGGRRRGHRRGRQRRRVLRRAGAWR